MAMRTTLVLVLALIVGCKAESKPSGANETVAKTPDSPRVESDGAPAASVPTSPDVVTEATPALEAGPSVVTTESVDGAALRKRITKMLSSDRSPVTLLEGESPLQLGKSICEAAVPKVPVTYPVLLKPNIGGFAGIKNPKRHAGDNGVNGRITDPEFVRGVIRCLKARGHTKITVTDSKSEDAKFWPRLMKLSGYEAMTAEEGVALVAINDDGVFDKEGSQPGKPLAVTGMEKTSVPTLLMPKIVAEHLDHGLYISLPKIKTHRFSVVSLGIKGLQGTVMYSDKSPAYRQKWRSHRELGPYMKALKKGEPEDRAQFVQALETFAERMVDVLEVQAPHVVLAEGAPAMGGDGFHTLVPTPNRVAIGGTNTVLVDAVGAKFLGLFENERLASELGGHGTSPLIELAAKRFGLDLSNIRVVGNGAELLKKPRPVHFLSLAPFQILSGGSKDAAKAPTIANTTLPLARASYAGSTEMQLDGKADERVWSSVERVSWDTNFAGESTKYKTHVRFAWKDDALYAYFELEGAGLFTDISRSTSVEREELYKEDCVEIFLAPDAARPGHYYEIEVGPHGHWLDIEVDGARKKGRFDQGWSSEIRVGTTRDAETKRVTIEIELKSKDIVTSLEKGARLPMGLFRMEGRSPDRNYLAWSPARTAKPKFHIPEAFGTLELLP
jgi:uncharacterized protein (DUF362 family)